MQISAAPPSDPKRRILKDVFGFDDFRPGQTDAMEALLAGRHVLTVMPTGAGKSLCYQVPALVLGGLTIVVSPLVALMQDQVAALRLAGRGGGYDQFLVRQRRQYRRLAAGGDGRDAAALSRPRAADDRADAGGAGQTRHPPDRDRRGALHFPMGSGLPARI